MGRDKEAEECFPELNGGNYRVTSQKDETYNCVAWAVGDTSHFWDDVRIKGRRVKGYYWPPGLSAETVDGWKQVFILHGYAECDSRSFETELEKVAIFELANEPSHVARQLDGGKWTSKLGKGCDIEHSALDVLEGEEYGKVKVVMSRPCKDGKRVRSL